MRPVLLAFALAALGWIGWGVYQRYSPEGRQQAIDKAQVALCRDALTQGAPDSAELARRVAKCDRMQASLKAK